MTADVIVLGLGAMGAAAAWRLSQLGLRVLGFEQYHLNHALGSSHGETRIIRQAYFEHPNYVPLLFRSYEMWRQLEALSNRHLLHEAGLILAGPPSGEAIDGSLRSAKQHGLRVEQMTSSEARRRGGRCSMFGFHFDSATITRPRVHLSLRAQVRAMGSRLIQ